MTTSTKAKPYTALAEVYDEVMARVDYELWADFIDEVIHKNHPNARKILELACGTGSLTFQLEKFGYKITAGDKAPRMIKEARKKATFLDSDVRFNHLDFLDIKINQRFDVVVCVFDSVNYLLNEKDLLQMFAQVKKVMNEDAVFIFDFTTPQNSLKSSRFLNNRKGSTGNGWHYFRQSRYDREYQIHYNTFEIEKRANNGRTIAKSYVEKHRQRAYTLREMKNVIHKSNLTIKAKYGEFNMSEANKNSNRITLISQ